MFLLDDHEIVRRGLHQLFSGEGDIEVVGEAGTATGAVERILAARPDVAILDVRVPGGSGIAVCREVRARAADTRCLMLTSYADDGARVAAAAAGASGYVLKETRGDELLAAVREVAAGRVLPAPAVAAHGPEETREGHPEHGGDRLAVLTEQERRILDLIGEGLTNRAIGERLHLAEKTVKNYVSGLLAKLGMQRRSQAAVYVARRQAGRW